MLGILIIYPLLLNPIKLIFFFHFHLKKKIKNLLNIPIVVLQNGIFHFISMFFTHNVVLWSLSPCKITLNKTVWISSGVSINGAKVRFPEWDKILDQLLIQWHHFLSWLCISSTKISINKMLKKRRKKLSSFVYAAPDWNQYSQRLWWPILELWWNLKLEVL